MMEEVTDPYVAFRTTEKGRVMINLFGAMDAEAEVTVRTPKAIAPDLHTY